MTKHTENTPRAWSVGLIVAGAGVLIASELAVGVWAFETASRSVMLGPIPIDAAVKTALGALAGAIAFGGAAITAWLLGHEHRREQHQGRIALVVTALASCVAISNLASANAYFRRIAEAPKVAASAEYAIARANAQTAAARLAGESLGWDEEAIVRAELQRASAIVARGERPLGSEPPEAMDLLRALIAHLLAIAPAAAYRLPAPAAERRRKRLPIAAAPAKPVIESTPARAAPVRIV